MVQHSVGTVAIECGRAHLRSSTEPSPIPERLFPAPMAHHVLSASTRTHSDPGDNSRDTIKYQHILIFRHNPSDQLYNVVYVCIKRIQIRFYYINRITRFKHMAQLVFICRVTLPFHRDNTWVRVRNLNRVMARVCSFVRSREPWDQLSIVISGIQAPDHGPSQDRHVLSFKCFVPYLRVR